MSHVLASASVNWLTGWKLTGNFTFVDLVAASTNALNGALLARRPDHFKNFTIVGILGMALLGGLASTSTTTGGRCSAASSRGSRGASSAISACSSRTPSRPS